MPPYASLYHSPCLPRDGLGQAVAAMHPGDGSRTDRPGLELAGGVAVPACHRGHSQWGGKRAIVVGSCTVRRPEKATYVRMGSLEGIHMAQGATMTPR